MSERVVDAYAALDYLRTLTFVDKERIGVMGWSHGAMVVESALWQQRRINEPRFKTGVAMYPWCDRTTLYAPMLVIVGSADDWTPSSRCSVYRDNEKVELLPSTTLGRCERTWATRSGTATKPRCELGWTWRTSWLVRFRLGRPSTT